MSKKKKMAEKSNVSEFGICFTWAKDDLAVEIRHRSGMSLKLPFDLFQKELLKFKNSSKKTFSYRQCFLEKVNEILGERKEENA